MRRIWVLAAATLVGCSAQRDLDEACRIARMLKAEKPESFSLKGGHWWSERQQQWFTRVESVARNSSFKNALQSNATASPGDQYALVRDFAKEVGNPGWECPDLETVLAAPDSDLEVLCATARSGNAAYDGALLLSVRPLSTAVRTAWAKARASDAPERFALLAKPSEWPENTFKDCAGLKPALSWVSGPQPDNTTEATPDAGQAAAPEETLVKDGFFSARFPCLPKVREERFAAQGVTGVRADCTAGKQYFGVLAVPREQGDTATAEKRVSTILDGATRKQTVTIRAPVKLDGLAAEQTDAEVDDARQGRVHTLTRVLARGERAWIVIAGGPKQEADVAAMHAFLESVKPTADAR